MGQAMSIELAERSAAGAPSAGAQRARRRPTRRRPWRQAALEAAGVGVVHTELPAPGRSSWSPMVHELFGLERAAPPLGAAELVERFVVPRDRARAGMLFEAPDGAGGDLQVDFAVQRKDGEIRHLRGRRRILRDRDGRSRAICTTLQDVSDLVRGEQERHLAHERLAEVARQTTVGEIASGLAHEISQPLAAISTFAMAAVRLHASDARSPELETALRQISTQAHRAGDALKRLIALARPSRSRRHVIDLVEELREIGRLVELPSRSARIEVRLELPAAPVEVDADPLQIQQLLLSLYRNAVEALEGPGQTPREIRIAAAVRGGSAEVSIDDSGPGIEDTLEPMLFMPFFTTKPGGTGLGLVTARTIARLHGGDLVYRTRPGGGGGFLLSLPLAAPAPVGPGTAP